MLGCRISFAYQSLFQQRRFSVSFSFCKKFLFSLFLIVSGVNVQTGEEVAVKLVNIHHMLVLC